MGEKFFHILLGGPVALFCPEDGRWARIFPSGWRTVNQRPTLTFTPRILVRRHRVFLSLRGQLVAGTISRCAVAQSLPVRSAGRERQIEYGVEVRAGI
jgi:hypothetical protein